MFSFTLIVEFRKLYVHDRLPQVRKSIGVLHGQAKVKEFYFES